MAERLVSGKGRTAGNPSPPMMPGAWNQAMRSTSPARSSAGGEAAAALGQHPRHAALGQAAEQGGEVEPALLAPAPAGSRPRLRGRAPAPPAAGRCGWRSRSARRGRSAPAGRRAACAAACRPPPGRCGTRAMPGTRQVRSGSSASTVPLPTSTASWLARSACAARRAAAPVIQRLSPLAVAMRPSRVVASFRVTRGRPRVMRRTKPAMTARASRLQQALLHGDPGLPQPAEAAAVDPRVGIAGGHHHARHAGGDQGVAAGRRAAPVGAGLQGDIGGGAARGLAGAGERLRFGVRAAAGLGPAAADHPALAHDDAADRGVRPGVAEAPAGERQGGAHVVEVVGGGHARAV